MGSHDPLHCILPPGILHKLARHENEDIRTSAIDTLALDTRFRMARAEAAARRGGRSARTVTFARIGGTPQRTIYDQGNSESQTPGRVARAEGQDPVSDEAVNQAYDGLGHTYMYYWNLFMRDSIDGQGMPIAGCVHYGSNYDNAFWDNAGHMFFGDGDGTLLTQTTAGIDVIGHELTHGITQHEANLEYSGQSGALNESVSDCFGIQIKQMALNQTATDSDWMIGAGHRRAGAPARAALDVEPGHRQPVRRPAERHGQLRRRRRCAHELGDPEPGVRHDGDDARRQHVGRRRPDLVRRAVRSQPVAARDVLGLRPPHGEARPADLRNRQQPGERGQRGLGHGEGGDDTGGHDDGAPDRHSLAALDDVEPGDRGRPISHIRAARRFTGE